MAEMEKVEFEFPDEVEARVKKKQRPPQKSWKLKIPPK